MSKIDNLENKVKYLENVLSCLKKNNNNNFKENRICLNETDFVPADVNNPTTEEVKIWTDANLSEVQKNNGTVLTYFVEAGNCNEPDFIWILDKGEITLLPLLIRNYTTIDNLRNSTVTPTNNDKVFIRENESVYYYDALDNESLDDSINIIRQGSYRWKRICSHWNVNGNNIYNANSGNVGIGTTNPSEKLEINGTAKALTLHSTNSILVNGYTALGFTAGTTNARSIMLGTTGGQNDVSHNNVFIGGYTGVENTSGYSNTFIGNANGYKNTTGYENTFIGRGAGTYNTTAFGNTFVGANTGYNNTTGYGNLFIGQSSGTTNTTGYANVFIGGQTGYNNTTGYAGTFVGHNAGNANTTGLENTFIGIQTGHSTTTGNSNNGLGQNALGLNVTGSENIAIGLHSGYGPTNLSNNIYIGAYAGMYEQNSRRVLIGGFKDYGNYQTEKNSVLLYGILDDIVENQTLQLNAKVKIPFVVGIGTSNISSCAALDVTSTSKGFLPPRMTSSQRDNISSPEEGLIIYNLDTHRHQGYNGSTWNDFY